MKCRMFTPGTDEQVGDPVVGSDSVQVVNILRTTQGPAKVLFHQNPVNQTHPVRSRRVEHVPCMGHYGSFRMVTGDAEVMPASLRAELATPLSVTDGLPAVQTGMSRLDSME